MTQKIALITGASRGLGRAAALHLAAAGIHVVGTYKASKAEADAVAREIEARGAKAAMLPLDAEGDAFAGFAEQVSDLLSTSFGRHQFDYLVNNAGIGTHAMFAQTTADQIDRLYRIHVRTPYLLTQSLLPAVADGGRLLFVSTGHTRFAIPGYSAYAAMKGAVEVMTRYAAKELGSRGIRVNCIAPGAIETDFGGGGVRDNADLNKYVASMIALGRAGLPDDIGGAIAALLSEGMHWLNGERIEVSGGQAL
jgi:NAD(P)-dependent dehydrogenase (short-subunit alcohol dehydrogenase family)